MVHREQTNDGQPGGESRRTLAAILSAIVLSAVVWGVVVFFHVN
jgi:hypothetical protein